MMKFNRIASMALALAMSINMLGVCAFAEEEIPAGDTGDANVCTCAVACTADAVNVVCPVCGAEGADISACKGMPAENDSEDYLNVVTLFESLPAAENVTDETNDDEKAAINEQATAAMNALDALSDEDFAKFNAAHSDLLEAAMALNAALGSEASKLDVTEYNIWVGTTKISIENAANITGITGVTGQMSYDATAGVLTMDNVTINGTISLRYDGSIAAAISTKDALTIKLVGANSMDLSSAYPYKEVYGIYSQAEYAGITFTGDGTLTITAGPAEANGKTACLGSFITRGGVPSSVPAVTVDGCTLELVNKQLPATSNYCFFSPQPRDLTVKNGATLICNASASTGSRGYQVSNEAVTFLIDATSTAEFSGTYMAARIKTPATSPAMTVTTSNDVRGYAPTVGIKSGEQNYDSLSIKYLKFEPAPTHTVTLTDSDSGITGFKYSNDSTDGTDGTWKDYTGPVTVNYGGSLYVKAVLSDNYALICWADGITNNPYKITNITENIAYNPISESKEPTPTATFTATGDTTGTLSNVKSGMKYKVDSGAWVDVTSASDIDLTGLSACTISVVKKGNEATTVDSDAQSIVISKATTPSLTATQPTTASGKGSIPTTTAHEYSSDNVNWTSATGTTELAAGTYYVRVKASGTVLASERQTIVINSVSKTEVAAPTIGHKTYNGSAQVATVAASDKYTVVTNNGGTDASNYDVVLTLDDSADYAWASGDTDNDGKITLTFTIDPLEITGATVGTFTAMTYTGSAQTPTATVTKDSLTVTGTWSNVTNVVDKTTFTANGNFTGKIVGQVSGMAKKVVDAFALDSLVTAPVKNAVPITILPDQTQYTGAVSWNGTPIKFLGNTAYTATVTLVPTANYTFAGLAANTFTYSGATATNAKDSGTVSITFPATADRNVTGVTTTGTPTKTVYNIGETFDPDGLTVTVTYDDGTTQKLDKSTDYAGISINPATMAADTTAVKLSFGGVESGNIAVSVRENLTSVTAPASIKDVPNGTAKTAASLGLPTTVSIVTSTGKTKTASVVWNVAAADYDTSSKTAQTFTVSGTVALPTGVTNVDNVSLAAQVIVSVKAGTSTPTPKPTSTPSAITETSGFVDRLYSVCLDRKPDAAGKADWVNRLKSFRISGTKAAYGFIFSPEFQNKGYSNEDYVEHLYAAFMGRASDAPGKANWVNQLNNGKSREEVFYGFANSVEFDKICDSYGIVSKDIETFVTRFYSVCLERRPDAGGLTDWSGQLRSKTSTGRNIAHGFIFSSEFTGKGYSNEDYIEHLYAAFMGRASDAAGKADWAGKLNAGASREDVFNGFVGSKEFSDICASYDIERG